MSPLIENQNIICISSIDWDFIWQQHHDIMVAFAENNRVLFIENTGVRAVNFSDLGRIRKRVSNWLRSTKGFRQEKKGLWVYSPIILPFPYSRIARRINRYLLLKSLKRWIKIMRFNDPIVWTFLPTPIVLDLTEELPHKLFIYYCTDNFAATSESAAKIQKYEKMVSEKADIVFVMAKNMLPRFVEFNRNVHFIPMGVNTKVFTQYKQIGEKPDEIKSISNQIIGYVGGIRDVIDWDLIKYLASKHSNYTFLFVGPIQTNISDLRRFKNIIFTGEKPHADLPKYIQYFDACIVPYLKNQYTDNVSLAKLNEYLIMGKPVISTSLTETETFNKNNGNILYVANDYDDFAGLLSKSISEDNEGRRAERKNIALNNSWDKKINQMQKIIDSTLKVREGVSLNWQKRLLDIYTLVRKRMVNLLILSAFIWLTIFYTPFIWILAKPLKINQRPLAADAIVVFGGGVGESGKAGQGYEERVQYAVELYRKGYSKNIIFSSGYSYAFKETILMKALAVSLGIPGNSIILEEKARNTYENVKFSKELLDKNNWNRILLVSSPYHMCRVKLVFNKIAKSTQVIYTPITNSLFYSHPIRDAYGKKTWKQITVQQINAILHEYMGILYYFGKGWI